jgi:hypothetical protein
MSKAPTRHLSDDEFGDLGLFDTDRAVAAQVAGTPPVAPPAPVRQQMVVPDTMQAPAPAPIPEPTPAPAPAQTGNIVSESTEVVPGLGTFVHRVQTQQRDVDFTVPPPVRQTVQEQIPAGRQVQTMAPGMNPEWVGKVNPVAQNRHVQEINGQLVPVETVDTMGGMPSPVYPPAPVEPVAQAPAPVAPAPKQTPKPKPTKRKAKKGELEEADFPEVRDVMILRPILREVHSLAHHATLALFDKNTYAYDAQQGDAMVYHSRNMLADRFMKSGFEWALWWDDDVVPPIGNEAWSRAAIQSMPKEYPAPYLQINPIQRLKAHNQAIIGGLYFARKAPWTAICHRTSNNVNSFRNVPRQEIMPVDWVGTGFLLVHRSVFEGIQAKFPELAPKENAVNEYEKVWNYFQPSHQQAEDVSFCARAKAAGFQPYVDLSVVCFHVGDYAFGPWNQR